MKKLALILALAMLLGILPVFAAESAFTDVADTDWFAEAVDFCVSQGCLTGVGERPGLVGGRRGERIPGAGGRRGV